VIPPEADAEFVASMEEVLEVYVRPYDARFPVVCMDEQPMQLLKETRTPIAGTPKHPRRVDYEYLNVAPKLWRSSIRIKNQWLANTIRFSNRYPLRQRTFHLPAAYPCIDLASLTPKDPQRFWITGRLPLVYHK
jgi:hypothetical protein